MKFTISCEHTFQLYFLRISSQKFNVSSSFFNNYNSLILPCNSVVTSLCLTPNWVCFLFNYLTLSICFFIFFIHVSVVKGSSVCLRRSDDKVWIFIFQNELKKDVNYIWVCSFSSCCWVKSWYVI